MRALAILLLFVGLIAVTGAAPYLESFYGRTRPQLPDKSAGQTYRQNVHGTVVYLTRDERLLESCLLGGGFAFALAGGVLLQRQFSEHGRDA